jgi:hypothetical protein
LENIAEKVMEPIDEAFECLTKQQKEMHSYMKAQIAAL